MSTFAEIPTKSLVENNREMAPFDWCLYEEKRYNPIGFDLSYKTSPSCKFGSPKIEDISKLDDFLLTDKWRNPEGGRTTALPTYSSWRIKEKITPDPIVAAITIEFANEMFTLPGQLTRIAEEIHYSKEILDLPDNWNEDGAIAIPKEILHRAVKLLVSYSTWILENKQVIIEPPVISPLPDGSIDLKWLTKKMRLLLNVKNNGKPEAHYYGDDFNGENSFRGKINTNGVQDFFALTLSSLSN